MRDSNTNEKDTNGTQGRTLKKRTLRTDPSLRVNFEVKTITLKTEKM